MQGYCGIRFEGDVAGAMDLTDREWFRLDIELIENVVIAHLASLVVILIGVT
ncbi:hypothetical protein [Phaeobacter sp. S60]|uniref:hypothetical protein n=1 Tax=Phaeobacter sp. S60 TaxID=1569353 RepID=UPI001F59C240|nr:hypothetical protein [Phaeobacter sp. S60]